MVKVEFYNGLKEYLAGLRSNPNEINTLEDAIVFNERHTDHEGGIKGTHPAFPAGQDSFEACVVTQGVKDQTYYAALDFIQTRSREGIESALNHGGEQLDGLLVPSYADGGVAVSLAAKAGTKLLIRLPNAC